MGELEDIEFLCIKDFQMLNGEVTHTKGKVYLMDTDSNMPGDKASYHEFPQIGKRYFTDCFCEIKVQLPLRNSDKIELCKEREWRTHYEKMSIELSEQVTELTQKSLDMAANSIVVENDLERANKIIDVLI